LGFGDPSNFPFDGKQGAGNSGSNESLRHSLVYFRDRIGNNLCASSAPDKRIFPERRVAMGPCAAIVIWNLIWLESVIFKNCLQIKHA